MKRQSNLSSRGSCARLHSSTLAPFNKTLPPSGLMVFEARRALRFQQSSDRPSQKCVEPRRSGSKRVLSAVVYLGAISSISALSEQGVPYQCRPVTISGNGSALQFGRPRKGSASHFLPRGYDRLGDAHVNNLRVRAPSTSVPLA